MYGLEMSHKISFTVLIYRFLCFLYCSTERQKYYKHVEKAKRHPSKYLSTIIDGMDQSKTNLPHFSQKAKKVAGMTILKTHLTAVLTHGHGIWGFFDICQWPHASNLTINLLLKVMTNLKNSLPKVWYLQMDNCGRENKNRFVLAFCCYLVQLGLFKKIKIGFLMVGHTHEDVDQVFSRFSSWLNRHAAITLDKLINGFSDSYTPKPRGYIVEHIFDITSWLTPYLNTMSMHSKPHQFKITLDESNRAVIHTKKWSTDKEWTPCQSSLEQPYLLKAMPTDTPPILSPQYGDIEFEVLSKDIKSSYAYMASDEDKSWWDDWLEKNYLFIYLFNLQELRSVT